MKTLDEIQAGETVYYLTPIKSTRLYLNKKFFVPLKVDRVTKTQIIIGSKRYKKSNGILIGRSGVNQILCIYAEGSVLPDDRVVKDETSVMERMERFVKETEDVMYEFSNDNILSGDLFRIVKRGRLDELRKAKEQFTKTVEGLIK